MCFNFISQIVGKPLKHREEGCGLKHSGREPDSGVEWSGSASYLCHLLCPPSKLLMQDGAKNGIYLAEYLEI